ncbi:hypothetical protein Pint_03703 [Pistacia integerrima]|uniref:Uncharacterized protein n=1 Tax=Pistacia integerrima TaxID=434235 RepID=A0ACC0Z6P1_9ROSI|nr:hypothetical protein Pint_03703 [Pistacia integerrima]
MPSPTAMGHAKPLTTATVSSFASTASATTIPTLGLIYVQNLALRPAVNASPQNTKIRASNGKNVIAKVVDECDSVNGCDHDHDYPPPCSNDIVDGSDAVWHALGLNIEVGVVDVTWSMA